MEKIEELVKQMTLEEKAGMCSGRDFWHLKGVERLGIPSIMVADGPHGLRKQDQSADHLGINDSIKAVCFPSAAGLAASFDKGLLRRVGRRWGKNAKRKMWLCFLGRPLISKEVRCVEEILNICRRTLLCPLNLQRLI